MAKFCITDIKGALSGISTKKDIDDFTDKLKKLASDRDVGALRRFQKRIEEANQDELDQKKREAYLTHIAKQRFRDFSKTSTLKPHEALRAYLIGTLKIVDKGQLSMSSLLHDKGNSFNSNMLTKLYEKDLHSDYMSVNNSRDIAMEMFEEGSTNNEIAKKISKPINESNSDALDDVNSVGGFIKKRKDFIANQTHNAEKMMSLSDNFVSDFILKKKIMFTNGYLKGTLMIQDMAFSRWKNFTLSKLNHDTTFEDFQDMGDRDKFMRSTFDRLTTSVRKTEKIEDVEGDVENFGFSRGSSLAAKVSKNRLLHFKTGGDWFDYNTSYGTGDLQSAIHHTYTKMGQTYAQLKFFGPNPESTYQSLAQEIKDGKSKIKVDGKIKKIDNRRLPKFTHLMKVNERLFDHLTGKNFGEGNPTFAKVMSNVRGWVTITKLGNTPISSISDVNTYIATMKDNGVSLSQSFSMLADTLTNGLNSVERKKFAALFGTVRESMPGGINGRYAGFFNNPGAMSHAIELFFKVTGQDAWDSIIRTGFSQSLSKWLHMNKHLDIDGISSVLRNQFKTYGIGDKEWDFYRRNTSTPFGRSGYIVSDVSRMVDDSEITRYLGNPKASKFQIKQARLELEDRLKNYFTSQSRFASIQPDISDIAMVSAGLKPGTVEGELVNSFLHLKTFTMAYTRRHIIRRLRPEYNVYGKRDYAGIASLLFGCTATGFLSDVIINAVTGRNPPSISDPRSYAAAFLRGGGAGVYASFLFNDYDKYGRSFITTAAGPEADLVDKLAQLFAATTGRIKDNIDGVRSADHPLRSLVNLLSGNIPMVNTWYTKGVINYGMLYGLHEATNPGYVRRLVRRVHNKEGSNFYLDPKEYAIGAN